jgi:hypothetical protein
LTLSEEDHEQLLAETKQKLAESIQQSAIEEVRQKVEKGVVDERITFLRESLKSSTYRLSRELNALARRGNLNLIIGTLATLAGFLIFGFMVLGGNFNSTTNGNFVQEFVPRISLILLIEIFAYFFLGLYKSSLNEIKYFQNELTNLESKLIAMEYAVQYSDHEAVSVILKQLASTERNFLLKKGESTVLVEQDKINAESDDSTIEKLTELVSAIRAPLK